MILVKTYFNTDHENKPVPEDTPLEKMPITYHGPFESMYDATQFMNEVWPDDDTDIYEQISDVFDDVPLEWVNDPNSLFGEIHA
jgi:hypothetical protein